MWCVLLLLTLVGITGRGTGAPAPDPPLPATAPVTQQHRLGAVEVSLQADRQTLGIAERLHLTLSVDAPSDITITLPQVTAKLGPFIVLRQDPSGPLPSAPHRQKWQQAYVLEAEHIGEQTIPSLTVSFQAAAPNATLQELNTEPLTITVATVLPDEADVTTPKDIAAPVTLTRRGLPPWMWVALSVLVALACLAGIWWYYRRQRRQAPPPPQPAHLLALQALEHLRREDLIAQQRVEEYYVRLSNILRRYVEWRFSLRAPEQTTEEFLGAVLVTGGLIATHQSLLSTFLQHCDLVKFARHQPSPGDMQQAWESAKGFVEQTADAQVVVIPAVTEVEAR